MIKTDINKAREIAKGFIRTERDPLFRQLDIDYMKALESGNTAAQAEIVQKKEKLRNATQTEELINATSEQELKDAIKTSIQV